MHLYVEHLKVLCSVHMFNNEIIMKILLDLQNSMRAVTLNSEFSLCGLTIRFLITAVYIAIIIESVFKMTNMLAIVLTDVNWTRLSCSWIGLYCYYSCDMYYY